MAQSLAHYNIQCRNNSTHNCKPIQTQGKKNCDCRRNPRVGISRSYICLLHSTIVCTHSLILLASASAISRQRLFVSTIVLVYSCYVQSGRKQSKNSRKSKAMRKCLGKGGDEGVGETESLNFEVRRRGRMTSHGLGR